MASTRKQVWAHRVWAFLFLITFLGFHGLGDANQSINATSQEKCTAGAGSCYSPKVICYFTNWSTNRTGKSVYHVSDIDTSLCTNIVYSFATLNPQTLTIEASIPEIDFTENMYAQVTGLKSNSKGLRVSLALGGWADSANSQKYSQLINNGSARAQFVHNTAKFLEKHNFDGLDMDWEYPRCWHGNCTAGPISDRNNFASLIRELHVAFRQKHFLLSVAVSASRFVSEQAYNFKRIADNVDWVGIMTYDYAAASGKTAHHSPYTGPHPNTVDSIQIWLNQNIPSNKLIMGIPLYGRSFTLMDTGIHGVGAPASIGKPGPFTDEPGFIAYFEFCSGWTYRSDVGAGAYAFIDNQWVSYNDVDSIKEKAAYVKQFKLGGVMVWALDLDDWNGEFCNQGKYPLLRELKNSI